MLSLSEIAITVFSPDEVYGYWIIMTFVFAFFAIIITWLQSKHRDGEYKQIVKHHSLHRTTTLLIVFAVFLLQKSTKLTPKSTGLVIL